MTPKAPKATMAALAGALDHCCRLISAGAPGVVWGSMALRDDVEDTGVGEIAEEGGVECSLERRCLRIGGGDSFEVRDGDADVGDAGGGLGLEPVLRVQSYGREKKKRCGRKSRRKGRRRSCDRGRAGRYFITFIVDAKWLGLGALLWESKGIPVS